MAEQVSVRIAVWGIGYHAEKNVLPAIAVCDGVSLTGLYSRDQQRAARAGARFGATVWSDADDMLASPDIDAVYICTPIGLHFEQGMTVIRAGKHLLCEKALTADAAQSQQLLSEARAQERALCEAFMYAFHPQFSRVAEISAAPAFGGIETLNCCFGMPTLDQPGFRHSRELGGGGFLDLGCYPISLAARLVDGQARVLSAAVTASRSQGVDMTGHATIQFSSGPIAHLEWGFGRAYRNEVSVWGVNQSIYADRIFSKAPEYTSHILVRDERGAERSVEISSANAFVEMLNAFATATRDPRMRETLWAATARQADVVASVQAALFG